MSMLNQMFLLEKYGMRLTVEQLAEVLGTSPLAIHRRICEDSLGIPTYLDGKKRYADIRDVATYMDSMREAAQRVNLRAANSCSA